MVYNDNSMAIIIFCSHLCTGEGIIPLEPLEWRKLAELLTQKKMQPWELMNYSKTDFEDILGFSENDAERLERLISRSGSISFKISQFDNMGIGIVTRADVDYPLPLKKRLSNACPPLFYFCGDLNLAKYAMVGFVGSRDVSAADMDYTKLMVDKAVNAGYGVVSGGARGVDSISSSQALERGAFAVEYISDSLVKKLKNNSALKHIQDGKLLILSGVKPDSGFNTGFAMMRNKYIYATSKGTVIIKSDFRQGGTWAGAIENLKNQWCPTLCWNNKSYNGNQALIELGAVAIDENWNGEIPEIQRGKLPNDSTVKQLSMFD